MSDPEKRTFPTDSRGTAHTEEERKDNRAAYLLPACRQTGQAGRVKSSKKYFSYRLPDSALVEAAQGRTRP
ncbi:MAG: hypothetical protein LBB72_01940 [Spirochaetaceae bacterium]|jgi:hypothetical protein|nr:hypothetical protein [Spirochaetaceae bacterium]